MTARILVLTAILTLALALTAEAQGGSDLPVSPVLSFVTVQPASGKPYLQWTKSPSPDVSGYVVYYFSNGEGHAIDTIRDPNATSYVNMGSASSYFVESYVVAALDSSGNISPLSNDLHTVLPLTVADSCLRKISMSWNSYASAPYPVSSYRIMVSENGSGFVQVGETIPSVNSYSLVEIKPAVNYCIRIDAVLSNGLISSSNVKCMLLNMEKAPDFMNTDFVTVNDEGKIALSFTVDPQTDLKAFFIARRRLKDNDSVSIALPVPVSNTFSYTDEQANLNERYEYMLYALNKCGIQSWKSNRSANMLLTINEENGILRIAWNSYYGWSGGVSNYMLYANTGSGPILRNVLSPGDTSFTMDYRDIMAEVSTPNIEFFIEANEIPNQYGITGKSRSNSFFVPIIEKITFPNAFTPDNDNLNDFFRPVLSFTPERYHLIITDRQNNIVFESTDHLQSWDGTKGGSTLPADVYLWYIDAKAPSGRILKKTGTVAIVKTR
jgi:gliding motility-associated-like protein